MTIKKSADQLQVLIDEKMKLFDKAGKEAKELMQKTRACYLRMNKVLKELEPVDSLIRVQNPDKCGLFDELIAMAKKEEKCTT